MDQEAGGHRIQRIPPTERRGRVHTSTVTVAVIDPDNDTNVNEEIPDSDLVIEWYSGSGAGGQHRNKHCNSIRLKHIPTGIVRTAQKRSRDSSYKSAYAALKDDITNAMLKSTSDHQNNVRQQQVGTGMRGDKRRTYRFQEDRVVDHLTGKKATASQVMRGKFPKLWS